jgi:hypothetical protein
MASLLKLRSITEPLRLEYDATHYVSHVVNSDGSYTITPRGTSGVVMPVKFGQQDGIILQFPTGEAGRAFNITLFGATNDAGAGGRKDWVWRCGYNIAKGGGPATAGEHAVGYEIENYWYQAGQGIWTEIHLAYTSKNDSGTRRLYSYLVDVNDDTCQMYFQSGTYEFRSFGVAGSEENYLSIGPTKISAYKPIHYSINDSTILYGWLEGEEGGDVPIVKVNTLNQVEVGSTTYGAFVPRTLQVGAGTGETGANFGIWGRKIGLLDSIITLNNASTDAGTGVVIECGWGDAASKTRFGMKNGNNFIIETWNGITWTNQVTVSPAGMTVVNDLTVSKKNGTITLGAQGIKQWVGNGSGQAAFGTNLSPALTPGSTYGWLKWVLDDGSTVYVPVWK